MVKFPAIAGARLLESVSGRVLKGDPSAVKVSHLAEPAEAGDDGVAFIIAESFLKELPTTKVGTLVVQEAFAERVLERLPPTVRLCIACKDAYVGLAAFSRVVAENVPSGDWKIGEGEGERRIHPTAEIATTARLGVGVVVGAHAKIGANTSVLANAVIGPECRIGQDCVIFPGVVLYPRTQIGDRVRLHANVVLGSDGFGYARGPQGSVKIWHLGRVIVGDDVEIGAGTTIDRGTMKDSIIESGAKIDNLCQIGHNGHVKSHAILCAQVGMAGNVTVGRGAILAGQVGVADKVEIGDGAVVGPKSGLSKDINPGEVVMGQQPARPRREWWKLVALFERLPDLNDRLKKLEAKLEGKQ
jgi:UDP-3-O-[3-hydroxymyristoyl] glucosamine N-acyltransferase